jgi:hypothetical protein
MLMKVEVTCPCKTRVILVKTERWHNFKGEILVFGARRKFLSFFFLEHYELSDMTNIMWNEQIELQLKCYWH